MSRSFRSISPLAAATATALLASAAMASSASAGTTAIKQVGGKLSITAASGDANDIRVEALASTGSTGFRVKDLGAGVTLSLGAGIGGSATYAPNDIAFTATNAVTSVRINAKDQADVINTTLTALPTQLLAGAGNDTVTVGSASATISGGAGNDLLYGGSKDDTLLGGSGNDQLFGVDGDDVLFAAGDTGTDHVEGGAGDDLATADTGTDTVGTIESLIIGD